MTPPTLLPAFDVLRWTSAVAAHRGAPVIAAAVVLVDLLVGRFCRRREVLHDIAKYAHSIRRQAPVLSTTSPWVWVRARDVVGHLAALLIVATGAGACAGALILGRAFFPLWVLDHGISRVYGVAARGLLPDGHVLRAQGTFTPVRLALRLGFLGTFSASVWTAGFVIFVDDVLMGLVAGVVEVFLLHRVVARRAAERRASASSSSSSSSGSAP